MDADGRLFDSVSDWVAFTGKSKQTIVRWIRSGLVDAVQLGPNREFLIPVSERKRLLRLEPKSAVLTRSNPVLPLSDDA